MKATVTAARLTFPFHLLDERAGERGAGHFIFDGEHPAAFDLVVLKAVLRVVPPFFHPLLTRTERKKNTRAIRTKRMPERLVKCET